MLIDLAKLPEDAEVTEVYEPDWWRCDVDDGQILTLDAPLEVGLRIRRTGNKYILDGRMSGRLLVKCDRCLEPYHHVLQSGFHIYLQAVPSTQKGVTEVELLDEDMEVHFVSGEELDLDEVIREQIFLSLPMKCVCGESCRGLCPVCGANLNRTGCSCEKNRGHPAFLKLKNLKTKNSRGD
ncbi:MAG: DUF177 domain-containing protein [Deltaproteobacteria bacterium]|nr:DUF177 domain-containing protein [Deltaproteobacteria bacterium]